MKEARDEKSRRRTSEHLLKAELHLENFRRILDDLKRSLR
jgi:hypothetical protein